MERTDDMINFDPEVGQSRTVRRWLEDRQDLCRLLLAEETAAQTYLHLARQLGGNGAAVLQRMAREAHAHSACLEGICLLATGEAPAIGTMPPETGDPRILLRKCYGRAMRILATYEARRTDPEYGPVLARLAAQQQDHCRAILELVGRQ